MNDWIATELAERATPQLALLLIGCLATAVAAKTKRPWLATVGVVAPLLALAWSMLHLAHSYARVLELRGFTPTDTPVPLDQRAEAISAAFSLAPLFIGKFVAAILPVATWVWGRVTHPAPEDRGLRALAVAAACVLALALWSSTYWHREFIDDYRIVCILYGCPPRGWQAAEASFVALERLRGLVVVAGGALACASVAYAVGRAGRRVRLGPNAWAVLLGLFGLAAAAKLWTADERRDARDHFRVQPPGYGGFEPQLGPVADPHFGPALEHCSFEWSGGDLIHVPSELGPEFDARLVRDIEWLDHCGEPEGIDALSAAPELAITRIGLALRTFEAQGSRRLGVASIRPVPVTRATTGEFVRLQTCVVELSLGPDGVPLDRFSTWGELAAAADAGEGALVVALP